MECLGGGEEIEWRKDMPYQQTYIAVWGHKPLPPRRSPPIRPPLPSMDVILNPRAARKRFRKCRGWKRISRDVAALRTDGQGPPGGPQGQPLQYQDQAPVPAEPVQRHLHFRRARPQRALKGVDQ